MTTKNWSRPPSSRSCPSCSAVSCCTSIRRCSWASAIPQPISRLTPNGPLLLGSVALLLFVKIIFSILSFASGVPGGLLMPMLAIGSMVGAVGGTLLIGNGFSAEPQLPAYLVLGMAGLFSGTVRAPLTGTALVAEMSGAFQCLPEMAIVAFISTVVANGVGSPPVYDSLKRRILVNKNASSKIE